MLTINTINLDLLAQRLFSWSIIRVRFSLLLEEQSSVVKNSHIAVCTYFLLLTKASLKHTQKLQKLLILSVSIYLDQRKQCRQNAELLFFHIRADLLSDFLATKQSRLCFLTSRKRYLIRITRKLNSMPLTRKLLLNSHWGKMLKSAPKYDFNFNLIKLQLDGV